MALQRNHNVRAIGGRTASEIPGIKLERYELARGSSNTTHAFAVRFEADSIRAEATAKAADRLLRAGFRPDVIVAHIGWGERLMLRDVWPDAKIIAYCEFYYRSHGQDVNFDAEFETDTPALNMKVRAKNAGTTLALVDANLGLSPTQWQRSTYPDQLQSRIAVIHDGIDTQEARPKTDAKLTLPGRVLRPGDEVITYVNRHLEPMRGLHIFLRALPRVLEARPRADVVIIGAPGKQAYGGTPSGGQLWKDRFLAEIADRVDTSRLHWLGRVSKPVYFDALAVSRVHVYLTYPFVLSWSLLEAMSCQCLVVASDTAPVREVISDKSTGLLVNFFDTNRLADLVIDGLARPPYEFAAMTAAARQTIVERFDRAAICMPRLVELVERWA
ncbi:MAG TPA: glycosyltransferase [Burkholderiaceae bacterium]|nr:glycosyltransferase [Burkholderiaceae bacterium]